MTTRERTTPPPAEEFTTASALQTVIFPPAVEVFSGLLVAGLTLLAGAPKLGKSWLALLLALAKATGGEALGVRTTAAAALFVGLEDSLRRLQRRLTLLLPTGEAWPESLHLASSVAWSWRGTEAVDELRRWHDAHRSCELIVLDTLARLRPTVSNKRGSGYDLDVEFVAPFQAFAIERGIALLGVVHTRKQDRKYRELDGLESVSGTLGLPGTADAVLVLQRGRLARQGELLVTGRDLPERKLALSFDPSCGLWSFLGDAAEVTASQSRQAVLEAMREAGEAISVQRIADATGSKHENVKKLVQRLVTEGRVLRFGRGSYALASDTTSPTSPISPISPTSPMSPQRGGEGYGDVAFPKHVPVGKHATNSIPNGEGIWGTRGTQDRVPGEDDA